MLHWSFISQQLGECKGPGSPQVKLVSSHVQHRAGDIVGTTRRARRVPGDGVFFFLRGVLSREVTTLVGDD